MEQPVNRVDRILVRAAIVAGVGFFLIWAFGLIYHAFDMPEHWPSIKVASLRFAIFGLVAFLSIVVALIARLIWKATE